MCSSPALCRLSFSCSRWTWWCGRFRFDRLEREVSSCMRFFLFWGAVGSWSGCDRDVRHAVHVVQDHFGRVQGEGEVPRSVEQEHEGYDDGAVFGHEREEGWRFWGREGQEGEEEPAVFEEEGGGQPGQGAGAHEIAQAVGEEVCFEELQEDEAVQQARAVHG